MLENTNHKYQKILTDKKILKTIRFIKSTFVYTKDKADGYSIINEKMHTLNGKAAWLIVLKENQERFNIIIHINRHFISITDEGYDIQVVCSLDDKKLEDKICDIFEMIRKVSIAKLKKDGYELQQEDE